MNKFRKFLIGMLIAASATCACGAAVACNKDGNQSAPAYYTLDLDGRGFDIIFEGALAGVDGDGKDFVFSGEVKAGVEVRFKVQPGANTVGTPVVKVNGETLQSTDGVYSFIMSKNSEISVTGLNSLYTMKLTTLKVTTDENGQKTMEERRIKFYDETGKKELGAEQKVEGGDDFKFALWTSPYYTDEFTVKCGYEVLESEGVVPGTNLKLYTVRGVASDGEIDVIGLTQQTSFANDEDPVKNGDGTEENPYKIRTPMDLYYLATLVNDEYYNSRFSPCYYSLENDIDMDGEQLYMIGNSSADYAVFNGHFNGNGHKIHNFYLTDEAYDPEIIDEETGMYAKGYLPYVGMFGYASASIDADYEIHPATISNLTLEDFTLEAHPAQAVAASTVGSLLGFGVGVEISGCKAVNGDVFVTNDDNQMVMMGGLVGRLQGAYGSTAGGTVTANAFVRSSSTDLSVSGTGSPRSAGGIVGYLISADENAVAYVLNSNSKGTVSGAMHSGGIVGTLGRFSSVAGCYSDARISAQNNFSGANVSEDFKAAYAGGIAGYAEESTVVYGCYTANYKNATVNTLGASSVNGPRYEGVGAYAGGYAKANAKAADLTDFIAYGNLTAVDNVAQADFETLGWSDEDWIFTDGALPEIKNSAARSIRIIAKRAGVTGGTVETSFSAADTMNSLYQSGLDEFVEGSGALRSWGYYFDEELTKKVPFGFVPMRAETTLYYDLADYGAVAGNYFVENTAYSNAAYIKLGADGLAELRNGGMYHSCRYAYDGEKIIIYRSALAALSFPAAQLEAGYFAYGGTVNDNGELLLEAYLTLANLSYNPNNPASGSQYLNQEASLRAVKETAFAYGEYQDESGVVYVFNKNGTGTRTTSSATTEFTFLPAGGSFDIVFATGAKTAVTVDGGKIMTIGGVDVQLKDGFKGSWQTDANAFTVFTFDGIDTVTMTVAGETPKTGSYSAEKGEMDIGGVKYKLTLTDGNVVIEGATYYVSDGFTGKWFMVGEEEWIEITLGGAGVDGYGYATIDYAGGEPKSFDAQYDVLTVGGVNYLRIYVDDVQYGQLALNAAARSAAGEFYSCAHDKYDSLTFFRYDALRGVWTGASEAFDSVTFNGRSASAQDCEAVLTSADGRKVLRGKYTVNGKTGTMSVNNVNYTLIYDEAANKVTVSTTGEGAISELLARRDEWFKIKLYDGDTEYEFDGKSNVGGKGKVTVTGGDPLEYAIAADGTVTLDGTALTANASGFGWKNGKTLTFRSGFVGEWMVSGTSKLLTIKEVGGTLEAEVTCSGEDGTYNFVYSLTDKTLTLTEGETVTVIRLLGGDEMNITRKEAGINRNYNCAKQEKADEYRGYYTGSDGVWLLDGLGNCRYGSGTAVFTPASGEPVKYTYKLNELGIPYMRGVKNVLFKPAEDGEEGYEKGGKVYKTVEVDAYYDRTVYDYSAETRTTYYFDGDSTMWLKADGSYTAVYKYEIVSGARCELIDIETGVRKNALMEQPGNNINITISDQITAMAGEGASAVKYALGVATLWKVNGDGSYEKAYSLAADNKENEYVLTDADGIKYKAVLDLGESEGDEDNNLSIKIMTSVEATANGVKYAFGDGYDVLWKVEDDGSYTQAYTYVLVNEKNREYELTEKGSGKKFTAKLTQNTDKTYTLTITPVQTTEQA